MIQLLLLLLSLNSVTVYYFPNAKKCWLIIKPEREEADREVFRDTAINVTIEGHKHLGAALGLDGSLKYMWERK